MEKVAIILINYKDYAKKYLKDCAASLININYPHDAVKVFVVDNQSSPESRRDILELMRQFDFDGGSGRIKAELIANEENVGYGQGNNSGIMAARKQGFEFFFLLNMDTEVDPFFLSKAMAVYHQAPNAGLIQSRLMLHDHPEQINSLGNLIHFLGFGFSEGYKKKWQEFSVNSRFDEIIYPSGAALLIFEKVLDDIGYFTPEYFMYHDDLEWGWKSRLRGYKNFIAYDSVVYHKFQFIKSVKQFYWMERNRLITTLVAYHWATLLILFPAFVSYECGLAFFSLFNGWFTERVKVYRWFFSWRNIKKIYHWRRHVQSRRQTPERRVVSDFAGKILYQEDFDNPILKYVANPIFNLYWQIAKRIIFW
ncbi:MAG: glycosyltransferase [Patescibacteria group bacterium]